MVPGFCNSVGGGGVSHTVALVDRQPDKLAKHPNIQITDNKNKA